LPPETRGGVNVEEVISVRILLVEDDLKIAAFVSKGLREAGFAVDHAEDGVDGLHLALNEPYDAAVVDIMLPELDGLSLIERVRRQGINTPVIILSAKRSVDDRIRGLQTGGDDYLTEDKGISLDTSSPEDLRVVADPLRMRQVLGNLLDNAVKYTSPGGEILLRAEPKGKQVLLLVEDRGTGIPPEEIPRIWDRLYRGDQSRSEKGLGLGLSLVKAVVQAHGGRVDVFSEPGKGSVFRIYLPAGM
jgi:signal transduction histidine kinase